MAETLSSRVGRLGVGSARALVLGGAAVAVLVVSTLLVVAGVDTVETVATLLVVPVFGVALYAGRGPGFAAAALATGFYVVLRRPDYASTGSVSFGLLIVTRAVAYSIVAHAGAWARTLVSDASAADDDWADSPLILREQRRARGEHGGDVEPWTSPSPVAVGAASGGARGPGAFGDPDRFRGPDGPGAFGGPGGPDGTYGRPPELAAPSPTAAMAPALFGEDRDRDWDDEPHPSDWRVGPSALPPEDPESGPWTGPIGLVPDPAEWSGGPAGPPPNGGDPRSGRPDRSGQWPATQGGSLGNPWSGQVPAVPDPAQRWSGEQPAARGPDPWGQPAPDGPGGPGGPGDPWAEGPGGPGERWTGERPASRGRDPWGEAPGGPGERWTGEQPAARGRDPWGEAPGGPGERWTGEQPAGRGRDPWGEAPGGPGERWTGEQPAARGGGGPGEHWSGRQPAVGGPAGPWPDERPADGPDGRWSGHDTAAFGGPGGPAGAWPAEGPSAGAPGGPGEWSGQHAAPGEHAAHAGGPGDRWSGQWPAAGPPRSGQEPAAGPPWSGQWPAAEPWSPAGSDPSEFGAPAAGARPGAPGTVDWGDADPLGPVERTPGADPWEQVQPDRMWRSRRGVDAPPPGAPPPDGPRSGAVPRTGPPPHGGGPTPASGGPPVPAVPVPVESSLPAVDPETRLWSARYLCDRLATEQREAARAGRPFSLVLVQVPDGPLAALSYRRQVTLLRELGHQFVAGGLVDHLVHVPDQVQHWFAVILPDTDRGGAQGFERRLRNGIGGYLRSRGLLLGELESASLTSPDDDSALGVIWETLIARGEPDPASGPPGLAYGR